MKVRLDQKQQMSCRAKNGAEELSAACAQWIASGWVEEYEAKATNSCTSWPIHEDMFIHIPDHLEPGSLYWSPAIVNSSHWKLL